VFYLTLLCKIDKMNNLNIRQIFIFFVLLFFTSINLQAQNLSDSKTEEAGKSDPYKNGSFTYNVGPGDVLSINVYDNSDLSGKFTVSAEGMISYPIVGQIKVNGFNILGIEEKITDILEKDYLYNPIVNVTINEYKSKSVNILGNVKKPGKYYLHKPTKLFDLIADVSIISPQSGNIMSGQIAQILRTTIHDSITGNSESLSIDLYELLVEGKEELNIYLINGDIVYIYIPEVKSVHIIGEVKKPGSFVYEEGITVLKAISLAGGPTKNASVNNSSVKRIRNNEHIEIGVKMSDLLEPGDVVVVPLSFW